MSDGVLWTLEDVDDLDCACTLLASASRCIGVQDELAREILDDVVKLLSQISGRSSVAVPFRAAPPSDTLH